MHFVLAILAQSPSNALGSHHQALLKEPFSPDSSSGLSSRTDSLPISPSLAVDRFRVLSASLDVSSQPLICDVAMGLLTALNFLFGVGCSNNLVIPETFAPLSPAQFSVLEHLFTSARRYSSSDEVPFDAPAERSLLSDL